MLPFFDDIFKQFNETLLYVATLFLKYYQFSLSGQEYFFSF